MGALRFSIGDLLRLTVVVSIMLGTIVSFVHLGDAEGLWLWPTFVAGVIAWFYGRWRILLEPSALRSLWLFGFSLAVPAIRLEKDLEIGAMVWMQSYWFGLASIQEMINPSSGAWRVPLELSSACILGAMANTLIVLCWIGYLIGRRYPRCVVAARWTARVTAVLMVGSVAPIAFHGGITAIYPGFALWLGSAVALGVRGKCAVGEAAKVASTQGW